MLRVTVRTEGQVEIWELEGKLSGEWVGELDRLWKTRSARPEVRTEVHLKAVSYVDPAGKQVLTEMHAQGAEIKGCGCMNRAVAEEIMREKSAPVSNAPPRNRLSLFLLASLLLGGSATLCAQPRPANEISVQISHQFHNGRQWERFSSFVVLDSCFCR